LGSVSHRRDDLSGRLGWYRVTAGKELDRLAEATAGEQLRAAVFTMWRWKGWLAAATDRGLHLSRHPRLVGRGRDVAFSWADLRSVHSGGALSADLDFGSEVVPLRFIGPHDQYVALLEAARGPGSVTVEALRSLAQRKLGKTLAFGYEATIDGLPDRLAAGETVERLAVGTGDFTGLLVVTGERLLLVSVGMRSDRFWETPRSAIRGLALDGDLGLRPTLADEDVAFRDVLPAGRRDELAAVLDPR
jgi:hypothetical protein